MCKPTDHLTANKNLRRRGTILGSISVALLVTSFSLTMPHLQSRRDSLGCDSMCYGSFTSARSFLSLIGSAVMGRFSDTSSNARKICMLVGSVATFVSMIIAGSTFSIEGMWLSMIPGALFQQNFNILKALFSDYHDESSSPSDRAGSVGMLGMAAGLAFMAGPLTGATLLSTFEQANLLGIFFCLVSGLIVIMLPNPKSFKRTTTTKTGTGILTFLNVKAARSPAALLFMAIRACMGLAFHVFNTIWVVSLKRRFDFGPKEHGLFMAFIGLTYALSQGFIAKLILDKMGANRSNSTRVRIIMTCSVVLGTGRILAFQTNSLLIVYCTFAAIVTSLGVINTILTADTSYLAPSDEIGSLFGILGAVESGSGMLGPLIGGSLTYISPVQAPLMAVVGLYVLVFVLVGYGYERFVLPKSEQDTGPIKASTTATKSVSLELGTDKKIE